MSTIGSDAGFDFAGFRRAFEAQDVDAWAAFFAPDGQWIAYRPGKPPRAPNVMQGRAAIAEFLHRVKAGNVKLAISDEAIGPARAAFCVTCMLADGRRIIEHVIIHFAHAKITKQVDVEAWD